MVTRAKFKCDQVTQQVGMRSILLTPVTSGDKESENGKFWKWTPSGKLELNCVNENVVFVPGKEYYLDISLAE